MGFRADLEKQTCESLVKSIPKYVEETIKEKNCYSYYIYYYAF